MRFAVALFVACIMPLSLAFAASPQESFIGKLGQDAIGMLSNQSITLDQRHAGFAKLFNENFDLKTIGHFALGRHWREASEQQQQEYQQLFEKMVVAVYTQRFDNYAGQQFEVKGSTPVDGAAADTLVHSQIVQTGGAPPVAVDWRVRDEGGGHYKIIDVMVEGVSMTVTQRSEFDSIVAQSGIDGLLQNIQQRVANPAAAPAPGISKQQ